MFEKDAEEYVNEHSEYDETFDMVFVNCETKKAFKDGAEFGYNKCKEEIDYLNKHWSSEEERKANEWHNINDIEPSKEQLGKQLLIRLESVIGDTDYDYLVYKYSGESITDVPGVIAWKEIK